MTGFDYLRLLAAVLVVAHHARVLDGKAPLLIGLGPDLGALGVGAFFVISGYLVTASLRGARRLSTFLAKRVLRIVPGLAAVLVLTAFVLGPWVSELSLLAYLNSAEPYLYVLRNLSLYAVSYDLPGVFAHTPFPGAVNGSLWSLRLELTCCLGLALLGALRRVSGPILAGLALAAAATFVALQLTDLDQRGAVFRVAYLAALNGFLFLAGAAIQVADFKPRIWMATAGLVLVATPIWMLGLPLAVIGLGRTAPPKLPADLSYGLYIYSFPLQQALAERGHLGLATSLAVTLPFALGSWFLIEKPALAQKARLALALDSRPSSRGLLREDRPA